MTLQLNNTHVASFEVLPTPAQVRLDGPASAKANETVADCRQAVSDVLDRRDRRFIVVVGPCSIHDRDAALEYAGRLARLSGELGDSLLVLMRCYFEKPRTTTGWKGMINDPMLDDSFRIELGLTQARRLLADINDRGVGVATEALDPITPQYIGDLVAWTAIGARTTESQTHREMASGLSTPVGFKNGTDGSLAVAVNALLAAREPHAFLGIDSGGRVAVVRTTGNRYGHVILRGGTAPNHDAVSVGQAEEQLEAAGLPCNLMIDVSHGNSRKDYRLQPAVLRDVAHQIADGNRSIIGVMVESHLLPGSQKLDGSPLRYGVSVTDGCIGWEETETCLRELARLIGPALRQR
jgi:3-deoxy-7-phosphoheptulonate synthase